MTTLPTRLEGLPRLTHIQHHETLHAAHNARSKIVNVLESSVKGDGSDDTTALNNLFQNVEKSATLVFPNTGNKYKASHLIVPKPMTFRGDGWWFGHRPSFGSAGWQDASVSEIGGSILECTATSGIFIDAQFNTSPAGPSGYFNLQDIFIKGTGDNTSTVTGIKTPGGDTNGFLNQGGLYYTADNFWHNAAIGNFKIGARLYTTYTSTYQRINLMGCDKGMQLGHKDNHLGLNTCTFIDIDSNGCNIAIQADNVGYSTFIQPTIQGYYDTGIKLNWIFNCNFISPYFESTTGNYSFDTDDCSNCTFQNGAFLGAQNSATKMRMGSASNNNTLLCGSGFNTLNLNGAYRNRIINGNPSYITNTGNNNIIEYYKAIGVTPYSIDGLAIQMNATDANHKSAVVFEGCNLALISPDNSVWVQSISNAGVASWVKMT